MRGFRSRSLPYINCYNVTTEEDGIVNSPFQVKDTGIYDQSRYPSAYEDSDYDPYDISKKNLGKRTKILILFED